MTRLGRFSWLGTLLAVVAGTALAADPLAGVSPECEQFTKLPSPTTSEAVPWHQRLSFAACRTSLALEPTSDMRDYPRMIARIDRAVQPSIATFRQAMTRGPTPEIRMLGAYGLGATYLGTMVRARESVLVTDAAYGGSTYGGADRRQTMHAPLELLLVPYNAAAVSAFQEVLRLAEQHPSAARANSVMTYIVADARRQISLLQPIETTPTVTRR